VTDVGTTSQMGQARRNGRRVLAGCGRASEPGASAGARDEVNMLFIMGDDIGFIQPHTTHSAVYLGELG
jgi:hypothetical protein